MIAIAHFAGLVVTTIFAAGAAVLLDWIFLKAMFQLMRPATARVGAAANGPLQKATPTRTLLTSGTQAKAYATSFGTELVQGTREIARQFGAAAVRR